MSNTNNNHTQQQQQQRVAAATSAEALDAALADMTASLSLSSRAPSRQSEIEMLQLQVEQLQARLLEAVRRREQEDRMFKQAMEYASAKSTANAVLHTLFDQAKAGKHSVLADWLETGVIPTRDGLKHWRVDLRDIRNEDGATLLHAAVGRTMAREDLKVKLVAFLLDRVGFDANVRDLFGRTPLHIAAMSNYLEVIKCLLAHGCDPTIQDRAGLTALSSVRTLSQPYEGIVKTLAAAEKASEHKFHHASESIAPRRAVATALFLQGLSPFVLPEQRPAFTQQIAHLVDTLLTGQSDAHVAFDQCVREHVPILFDAPHSASQVTRLDKLFAASMFANHAFIDALRVEIDGYGLSLVSQPYSASSIAGATWIGVLLKLIQSVKTEAPPSLPSLEGAEVVAAAEQALVSQVSPQVAGDVDIEMESESPSLLSLASRASSVVAAVSPLSGSLLSLAHSSSSSSSLSSPSGLANSARDRQVWHYAVLFRASTRAFPGTLTLAKGADVAVTSEDVSKYFPLEDRILIGKDEFVATAYNAQTRELKLDHPFEGNGAAGVKAYLLGSCSTLLPPFVKAKQILEREPGNKFEDQNSDEQELFQDYQFLNPESDYEVAVKLGPVSSARDARAVANEWKRQCREHFEANKCISGLKACAHSCPQRSGQSLCCETMAALGREIAKTRFGRATFSRTLPPRAALQKYQSRFLGSAPWPGSPSSVRSLSAVVASSSSSVSLALEEP